MEDEILADICFNILTAVNGNFVVVSLAQRQAEIGGKSERSGKILGVIDLSFRLSTILPRRTA